MHKLFLLNFKIAQKEGGYYLMVVRKLENGFYHNKKREVKVQLDLR